MTRPFYQSFSAVQVIKKSQKRGNKCDDAEAKEKSRGKSVNEVRIFVHAKLSCTFYTDIEYILDDNHR